MTTRKFGAALPYTTPRSVAQLAQLAEENGWGGVFMGDAIWCEDPMIGLAAAAVLTERIRLGMMVIPTPIRRPWKVASESVGLDHLSNGRLRPPVERSPSTPCRTVAFDHLSNGRLRPPVERSPSTTCRTVAFDHLSNGRLRPPVERSPDPGPGDRGGMDGLAGFSG
jgi:hypothetical protein